jgi:hypothetical protein
MPHYQNVTVENFNLNEKRAFYFSCSRIVPVLKHRAKKNGEAQVKLHAF